MTNEADVDTDAGIKRRSPAEHLPKWQPGQSGNPSGRPKGFSALIRDKTLDGVTLVEHAISVLKGIEVNGLKPSPELSFRAMEWLADRGWGKPLQNVEHSGEIIHNWDAFPNVDTDVLKAFVRACRALDEAKANVIDGESRMLGADEDESSN